MRKKIIDFINEKLACGLIPPELCPLPLREGEDIYHHFVSARFLDSFFFEELISDIYMLSFKNCFANKPGPARDHLIPIPTPFVSDFEWELFLRLLAARQKILWNPQSSPLVSKYASLKGRQTRMTFTHHNLKSQTCSSLVIRLHKQQKFSLENFHEGGHQSKAAMILAELMGLGKNLLVTGAAGSGKTSLLKALSDEIPEDEHVVSIEDTAELFLCRKNCQSLVSNSRVSLEDLVLHTLRLSASRIILGEIRGAEVRSLLMAANSGHQGILTTLHSDSAEDVFYRLRLLGQMFFENSRETGNSLLDGLFSKAFPYIVFLKKRRIQSIIKILGHENHGPIFKTLYKLEKNLGPH